MNKLVTLCCVLLSVAGVSSGTFCLSNTRCPRDQAWCVQNCSAIAIEEFNLTASHGNCEISSTNSGITYGCLIGTCSTEHCVASSVADTANETRCCCTRDFCNTNFTVPPTIPTDYHIYPSPPSHVTPDQLVCEYYNCTDEAHCVRGYEVCDENRLSDYDNHFHVCATILHQNSSKVEILFKGCLVDQYDSYNDTCVLDEYPVNFYSCVCNATLCNSDGNLIVPLNHTFKSPPAETTEPAPTTSTTGEHIYLTYPQHTTPDQLVCEYYNCSGGDYCVRGYEVCDENPSWVGDTCIAVLQRNDSELKVVYQSCFIRDAGTFHENCILREQPANVYSCLCNTTLCNGIDASFIPPSNSTHTSTYKPTDATESIPTSTTTAGEHIYPTYPQHTTPDQLVCEYYNCTGGDYCVRGYEVCDENPSWVGDTCIAVLQRSNSELEVVYQSCFIRDAGTFHENCILREQPANVYSCLCNTTLCNGINASLIAPSNTMPTSTYKPKDVSYETTITSTDKTTATITAATDTVTTSDNDKTNYAPFIYGINSGIGLLIVLIIVVIVVLVYCRVRTGRQAQSVSYNKLINS